jgi:uncharacterized integral membrane protein (TIGR00698 family)
MSQHSTSEAKREVVPSAGARGAAAPAGAAAKTMDRAAVWPGLALAGGLGLASMFLAQKLAAHVLVPEVFIALVLGAIAINTPLARLLRLAPAAGSKDKQSAVSPYGPGLAFVSKTLLRASVVLMGLRIQTLAFGTSEILTILLSLAVAIPSTFLLTHALAYPLGVSRRLADMIAAGTMICGASAVNAVAPVIGAKKEDQGIALATVFLFSAVAMIGFRSIAAVCGLSAVHGGLWSGLAVNDLASAVAVGAQMGPGGAEMAAASKSARIVMLAPILVAFAFVRGSDAQKAEAKQSAVHHFPPFVAGFVILAVVRMLVDMAVGPAAWWKAALEIDRTVVSLAMAMVSVSIGLHLRLSAVLTAGARAVALGGVAATTMAGLNLLLLVLALRGAYPMVVACGAGAVAFTFVLFRFARWAETARVRREAMAPLAVPRRAGPSLTGPVRLAPATGEFPSSTS